MHPATTASITSALLLSWSSGTPHRCYRSYCRPSAVQSNNYAQVFPHKEGPNGYNGVGFTGVTVYMTTPDPPIGTGTVAGGPVGATSRWNEHFIVSGPLKQCNPTCEIHPYGNWWDSHYGGSNTEIIDLTHFLTPGTAYAYQSLTYLDTHGNSTGYWHSQWCQPDGSNCQDLVNPTYFIGFDLPNVVAGGESTDRSVSFGSITAERAVTRLPGGSLQLWCYDPTSAPWITGINSGGVNLNGSISSCFNTNYWTVGYH